MSFIKNRLLEYSIFILILFFLYVGVFLPVKELIIKGVSDSSGSYIGLSNFTSFYSDPVLMAALRNSIFVSLIVAGITTVVAFGVAYGLTHSCFKGRFVLASIIQLPLFVPSIFPSLGLIYLFGNQGIFKPYLSGFDLYGAKGVIMGGVIFTLPHAVIILRSVLKGVDQKLYDAARSLGAGRVKQFYSVTIANVKYGLISTFFVIFILALTDFGIAKILAGNYPMLATEIYKQVIGQFNFSMGATISLVLFIPAVIAFLIDGWARKKQSFFANSFIRTPIQSSRSRDFFSAIYLLIISIHILFVIGIVIWGSFVSYWPYDFSFTLYNYNFDEFGYSWQPYWNSLKLASSVACIGLILIYLGSYLSCRCNISNILKLPFRLLALMPLSIPGTVLGLAYIFVFNKPDSILYILQGTFFLLVINTIIHLFPVSFLTMNSALGQINRRYELVGLTMGVPKFVTIFRVVLPLSIPIMLEVFFYLFVNTLTTVSAVVFLYTPDTVLASITILHMDDAGALSSAAAMGTLLLVTAVVLKLLHWVIATFFKLKANVGQV